MIGRTAVRPYGLRAITPDRPYNFPALISFAPPSILSWLFPGVLVERNWLALSYLDGKGVGPVTARRLLAAFGDPENILRQNAKALREAGASEKAAAAITGFHDWEKVRAGEKVLELAGAKMITENDDAFPKSLRRIDDPPFVLFVLGEITPEDALAVSMVGTRKPTEYGLRTARNLARQIAECGVCVVSGLAYGIDAASHEGALLSKSGRTIAVLGSGIDVIYPTTHAGLAREIAKRGAVVTEFFPGTSAKREHFPRRNRLIAGLSNGVVVVEAAKKSGTMYTVDFAAKQGKPVFGVPGPIDSHASAGVHGLIRDGATPVFEAMDVLSAILPEYRRREDLPEPEFLDKEKFKKSLDLTGDAGLVLEALSFEEPRHVDELGEISGLPAQRLLTTLLEMELRGVVAVRPGKRYLLCVEKK